MKNFFLTLILSISVLISSGMSINHELFEINYSQIQEELSPLNELETYVLTHTSVTLSEMQSENNILSLNISNGPSMMHGINESMSDIPAFLWGFCLGPIGVIIVWIIDEDDLLMSVVGCLVSSVLFGGGALLVN